MTIASTAIRKSYTGDGVTTAFSFPYLFLANGDLTVIERIIATGIETVKTITTHYTVTGAGVAAGGTVTAVTAPASTVTWTILREPAITQLIDIIENDPLPAETAIEEPLDRLTMIAQRLDDQITGTVRLADSFDPDDFDTTLPVFTAAAQTIRTNAAIDGFEAATITGAGTITIPVPVSQGGTNAITAAAALTSLGALPLAGGTMTGDITMTAASIIEAEGAAVASVATCNIWATDGNTRHITGSTGPITSFGTAPQAGAWMKVIFDSTPTLTHSANLNIVNGGVDITVVAGSVAYVYADTTTQLDVLYLGVATQAEAEAGTQNASLMTPLRTKQAIDALGSSITILAEQALTSGTSKDFTIPSGAKRVTINIVGGSTNGNTNWQIQLGDAGGIEATGYLGSCQTGPTTAISTTAMLITASYSGTGILHGSVILSLEDASDFTWVSHSTTSRSDNAQVDLGAFSKSLSAELTTVRLTTVTPNTFDAGVASGSSE